MRTPLLMALSAVFAGAAVYAAMSFRTPDSYEKCVVDEMRGQAPQVESSVAALCRRQFKIPEAVFPMQGQWSFSVVTDGEQVLHFNPEISDRYVLKRVTASASNKPCDKTGPNDWVTMGSSDPVGSNAAFYGPSSQRVCLRLESVVGVRK